MFKSSRITFRLCYFMSTLLLSYIIFTISILVDLIVFGEKITVVVITKLVITGTLILTSYFSLRNVKKIFKDQKNLTLVMGKKLMKITGEYKEGYILVYAINFVFPTVYYFVRNLNGSLVLLIIFIVCQFMCLVEVGKLKKVVPSFELKVAGYSLFNAQEIGKPDRKWYVFGKVDAEKEFVEQEVVVLGDPSYAQNHIAVAVNEKEYDRFC